MALVTSILTGGVNNHPTTSEEANAWSTDFISQGIVGTFTNTSGVAPATGALAVNAQGTPDMTVAVTAGVVYVTGTPTSQNSQTFRVKLTANQNVTISANSSGSTKYDWVYVKLDATKLNGPSVAGDDAATLVTSRSTSQSTDDGTPPTYGYAIAVVTVSNGASSITNGNIRDRRANCIVNLGSSSVSSGWTDLGYAPNTVTANGNRSYSLVFNSVDLTSTVSNGMRLKLPRTVTPPTQCTSLNGSNQYWNKTSGLTSISFTDDFVVSAWVKLSSYTAGKVASRFNGTSGWQFGVESTGQLSIFGYSGSGANYTGITSYQSIPLNKWVHIAAQLDMSSSTMTGGTANYLMINGVDVLGVRSQGGTNPSSLIQAGNLEIGSANGGATPFPGKISQVALYSAKVTQATILASMNQTLTGSETSLVGAWKFNGNGNDSSANALNLTAQNSATATTTDSPMNATEYGIIMANSFSTNTTLTVQVPEGYSLPTSGGIGLSSYSTQKTPYGFPGQKTKWAIDTLGLARLSVTPSASTWVNPGHQIYATAGEWRVFIEGYAIAAHAGVSYNTAFITLSTANNSQTDKFLTTAIPAINSSTGEQAGTYYREGNISLSAATTYYLNVLTTNSSTTIYLGDSSIANVGTLIRFENAYL